MDMMILGEVIRADATGVVCTGYWMPAKGNEGVAGLESFYVSGAGFTVALQTKASDEADPSSGDIGSASVGTTPGLVKFDVTAAKDLARYVVSASTRCRQETGMRGVLATAGAKGVRRVMRNRRYKP